MRNKRFVKGWLIMNNFDHSRFLQPHDLGVRQCPGCCQPPRLSRQASFSEKLVGLQNGNNGFLAFLGNHCDLDLAALDVEHRIRRIALRKDNCIRVAEYRSPAIRGSDKRL